MSLIVYHVVWTRAGSDGIDITVLKHHMAPVSNFQSIDCGWRVDMLFLDAGANYCNSSIKIFLCKLSFFPDCNQRL